jgi:hypothetical protein
MSKFVKLTAPNGTAMLVPVADILGASALDVSKFVKLTAPNGTAMLVPVADILGASALDDGTRIYVAQRAPGTFGGTREQACRESIDEVQRLLNSDARHVCGRLHPDITDISEMPAEEPR